MLEAPVLSVSRKVIEYLLAIRDEVLPDGCNFSKQQLTAAVSEIEALNLRIATLEAKLEAKK